jgi:hypothetical protein
MELHKLFISWCRKTSTVSLRNRIKCGKGEDFCFRENTERSSITDRQRSMGLLSVSLVYIIWSTQVNDISPPDCKLNFELRRSERGNTDCINNKRFYVAQKVQFVTRYWNKCGTRWCSWLRHCSTSWKIQCLIPDLVIGIYIALILAAALWHRGQLSL